MTTDPQKIIVTWQDVSDYIDALVKDIKKKRCKFVGVFGLPRGGLIIATLLSYRLDIPLLMHAAKGCLIVDDIADSGRTLSHYRENDTQFNRYFITTMYYKERSEVVPDFYFKEKGDAWIVFPWEQE